MEISLITYFSLFLCALGGIQGLILAAALFKVSKKRSGDYKWLIALVICVSVTLLGRTLFAFERFVDARLPIFTDLILFLYGPLFYFFVQSSLKGNLSLSGLIKHLIPAILHVCSVIPQFLMSSEEYIRFTSTQWWFMYIVIIVSLALIHNGYYWWKSKLIIKTQLLSLGDNSIDHISTPHKIYGVLILLFTVSVALLIPNYFIAINLYQLTWIFASWLIYGITYYLIFHPHNFGDHIVKMKVKQRRAQTEKLKLKELASNLKDELEYHKVHLNPEISLATLSSQHSTNSVLLSKAINQEFQSIFYALLNRYRVDEFISLAKDKKNSHLNYLGLATQAGFNSKTTFNKYFKKYKGTTPQHYLTSE